MTCKFRIFSTKNRNLSNGITLNISIVVFAGPHVASLRLHGERDHVVYKPVLVPDSCCLELGFVLPGGERVVGREGFVLPEGERVVGREGFVLSGGERVAYLPKQISKLASLIGGF